MPLYLRGSDCSSYGNVLAMLILMCRLLALISSSLIIKVLQLDFAARWCTEESKLEQQLHIKFESCNFMDPSISWLNFNSIIKAWKKRWSLHITIHELNWIYYCIFNVHNKIDIPIKSASIPHAPAPRVSPKMMFSPITSLPIQSSFSVLHQI